MYCGLDRDEAREHRVIAARHPHRSFADGFITEAVSDLWEPWMRAIAVEKRVGVDAAYEASGRGD